MLGKRNKELKMSSKLKLSEQLRRKKGLNKRKRQMLSVLHRKKKD